MVQELIDACRYLYEKGLATSTSGNLSIRVGERIFLTATGTSLKDITEERLAITDTEGKAFNNIKPTKEIGIHLALFKTRPHVNAIVHVHPVHSVAVANLLKPEDMIPAATPQFVMRAGLVPVIPYHPPGSIELVQAVNNCRASKAMVLQNHGVVTFAETFNAALGILEELEENCKILLLTSMKGKLLNDAEIDVLLKRTM